MKKFGLRGNFFIIYYILENTRALFTLLIDISVDLFGKRNGERMSFVDFFGEK